MPQRVETPQQVFGDELYEIYYRFLETEDEYFDYAPRKCRHKDAGGSMVSACRMPFSTKCIGKTRPDSWDSASAHNRTPYIRCHTVSATRPLLFTVNVTTNTPRISGNCSRRRARHT